MLSHSVGSGWALGEVSEELRKSAASRRGDWVVRMKDRKDIYVDVVFTEKEWAKMWHTVSHGLRNNTKTTALYANLEQNAQMLWPTGSLEHVAMRHLGATAAVRYLSGYAVPKRCAWMVPKFLLSRLKPRWLIKTSLTRKEDTQPVPPPKGLHAFVRRRYEAFALRLRDGTSYCPRTNESAETKSPAGQSAAPNDGDKAGLGMEPVQVDPSVDEPAPGTGAPLHGGNTPADAKVLADSIDGRTTALGDNIGVVGQNFDKSVPHDHAPVVGAVVGPIARPPNVYSNTAGNVVSAKVERLDKKYVKPDISPELKRKIGKVISTSIHGAPRYAWCSAEKVKEWCTKHFHMEGLKSGKWSVERFESSMNRLIAEPSPSMMHSLAVKAECMPLDKPPRMLIADGNTGQLMGLAVCKCFEDLLFEHFEDQSIKHVSKREAVKRIVTALGKEGSGIIEGDGSAWDTTCNAEIRALIENPILLHIMENMMEFGVVPPQWLIGYDESNWKKTIRAAFTKFKPTMLMKFDAIRRSGDRKTSSGNYHMNRVMMTCAIFKEPHLFLDPDRRWGIAEDGTKRWCYCAFEGDDSIVAMKPPMKEGSDLATRFLKVWKEAGFRMKIVFCKDRATFMGYHIACEDGCATGLYCPELPRALNNSGVSVSTAAISAFKKEDTAALIKLAAASAIARAADFAGILPTVSGKYLQYAQECDNSNFRERDVNESRRHHGPHIS